MSQVIADMSMSLDGKIAKRDDDISRLVRWYFDGDTEVGPFRVSQASAELLEDAFESVGAIVGGRQYFDSAQGWGGQHPMGVPVYILTHEPPADWPADSTIRFVTDGVESAIAQAREAAGGKDVAIATPSTVRQCLDAGLLDALQVNLVPGRDGRGAAVLRRDRERRRARGPGRHPGHRRRPPPLPRRPPAGPRRPPRRRGRGQGDRPARPLGLSPAVGGGRSDAPAAAERSAIRGSR